MADDAGAALALDDTYERDQDELHELAALKPHERAALELKAKRLAKRDLVAGRVQAFAKLRDEDRALLKQAVEYWGKAFAKSPREVDPPDPDDWEGQYREWMDDELEREIEAATDDDLERAGEWRELEAIA